MSTIVSTDKSSVLVILRREYLDITDNFCAAKLIEYFKHWTKWKLKNHRTPWVYQPLKKIYADLMGEHSLHVIRSAIALLEEMGILEKQRNPGNGQDKTWQYKLHFDVLNRLLEHRKCKTELSGFTVEQHLRSDPKTSKPQQHAAVGEVESGEVDWEVVVRETETWEKAQTTSFVEEEPVCQIPPETPQQEQSQTPHYVEKPVCQIPPSTPQQEQSQTPHYVWEPIPQTRPETPQQEQSQPSRFVEEQEEVDSTHEVDPHEDQFSEVEHEVVTNTDKPSKREIAEICTELRRLRINPEPCLGVVKKYWGNVQGAIARVKEALAEGWCENPTGLFINSCKSGAKGKNVVTEDVSAWFEWARRKRIAIAMSGGVVYTPEGEAVELGEMMRRFPMKE